MSEERADLDYRIELLEAMIADPLQPARMKQLANFAKKRIEFYRDQPEHRDEFHDGKRFAPIWMREPDAIQALLESGAYVEDGATGAVTLRWDLIADEHRDVAVSMANEMVALYRGRTAGGRPKK